MQLNDRQTEFKAYLKSQLFNHIRPLTFDELETKAGGLASLLFEDLSALESEEVLQELTEENTVEMALGDSIVDRATFKLWIEQRRQTTETPRWDAYKKLLISRDWEANVINTLDAQTDDVVELLGDPTQVDGTWPRRGLLMGEVQSGKTATYLGILNKALDYGYRVIIVIGGHTEDLRQQTQTRFDTDLLGVDSETWEDGINNAAIRYVGVGKNSGLRAHLMTTVRHDFSRSKRGSSITWVDGGLPTVFVTKKNPSLLNNIRTYIKDQAPGGRLDIPLIVVDDESDWGSPNTRDKIDPTSVNRAIRALLDVSTRSSYLAITATPFANIFIDDQAEFEFVEKRKKGEPEDDGPGTVLPDLFPSDFIRVAFPPSNYFGIGTYFPEGGHALLNTEVDDCLKTIPIKHKNHHPVTALPESMKTAMIDFLLGTAVRRIRDKKTKAASMLINVSRFKSVERDVADRAEEFLKKAVAVILGEFARRTTDRSVPAEIMRELWGVRFASVKDVTWDQISEKLLEIAHEFRIDLVNGDTAKERAKRRKLMTVTERQADDLAPKIVVGGDILSRGLTLDGLQVSYFVREPRTMDTLMQMGRWFGYRAHFDDLVRIWMPETTRSAFTHSAEVTEELRETLVDMKARGLTPRDFGLRVRVHPDSVDIVAANKGRDTEIVEIGPIVWENRLAESYDLTGIADVDATNLAAVEALIARLGAANAIKTSGDFDSWMGVPLVVVQDFFRSFQGDQGSQWFNRGSDGTLPIADAFKAAPGCDRWQVVLVNSGKGIAYDLSPDFAVNMSVRNKMGRDRSDGHIRLDRRRVSTGTDVVRSLMASERNAMEAKPRFTTDGKPLSSQAQTLSWIDHPLLMIYVVTAEVPDRPEDDHDLVKVEKDLTRIAVAIAFPKMTQKQVEDATLDSKVYQVNQVYWRAYNGYVEDPGDDEFDGDEI
ncbi:Z1 domain-containing protein [Cryobacterium sp. Y57]|uniref:Z1 domain-containing protein n=1 Tax=Cryobacterium sp. Y57 TaxID=2048287 RepID=UPI000CE44580|nr:Z1 domain-containing protein [Cryobacterium sp. Y57]